MLDDSPERGELARAHIWVTGRVQNVGFRAYVAYNAQKIEVTGWVRNIGYNTVEAVAEGTQAQIEQFLEMVRMGPRGSRIDESHLEAEIPAGEFQDFQVRASR
jgi:acylphosphatase